MTSPVIEGVSLDGDVNTPDTILLRNIQSSIRRGYPQVWSNAMNGHRICLVGGGPSINDTFDELRALVFNGAKLVALNGAYQWCLDRNLKPAAHVILDARPSSAAFIGPPVPECRYYLCSQCDPSTWDAVADRPWVGIWHAAGEPALEAVLDAYYLGRWARIPGGTTVGTRSIALFRMLGFLRFNLFGFDSCWFDHRHHAYQQPQNDRDLRLRITIAAKDSRMPPRDFWVAPWHLKQVEDMVLFIKAHGDKFLLHVHGDGLIAYLLQSLGTDYTMTVHDVKE